MRSALVDNSTLSSVQRLIGAVAVSDRYIPDGDIAAFDHLIQALLFYDTVAYVDDYKPEHAAARRKDFDYLRPLAKDQVDYGSILDAAYEVTQNTYLSIRGGKLGPGLLSDVLRDLDLHVAPAWQLASSDFYLRIRLLADLAKQNSAKDSALMTAIYEQMAELNAAGANPDWKKELLDSKGRPVPRSEKRDGRTYRVAGGVNAFGAALNWMTLRGVFYILLAAKLNASLTLHPIRHDFLARVALVKRVSDIRQPLINFFKANALEIVDQAEELLTPEAVSFKAPLFSAWAIACTGSPRAALDHVLEVRNAPEAQRVRTRFREIEHLQVNDRLEFIKQAAKLRTVLESELSALRSKFVVNKGQITSSVGLSISLINGDLSLSASGEWPTFKRLFSGKDARAVALLRNITLDLIRTPRLAEIADSFRRNLVIDENLPKGPVQVSYDEPHQARSRPYWKEPM